MLFSRLLNGGAVAALKLGNPSFLSKVGGSSTDLVSVRGFSTLFSLSSWPETLLRSRSFTTTHHQPVQETKQDISTTDNGKKQNIIENNTKKKKIAVGISGGVDSAVAALLLQQAGHDVIGVFMRNWDETEETGKTRNCTIEKDYKDAAAVCAQLNIPLHEADFIAQYWNEVFTGFLAECSRGLTPNPDLACNRYIKFGALLEFAKTLGVEAVATGHYARIQKNSSTTSTPSSSSPSISPSNDKTEGERDSTLLNPKVQLLKGIDETKDQSYFLASVHPNALEHVIFPLGEFQKKTVREIAAKHGLIPAEKRSSAGICFIGRRNFGEFLEQYLPTVSGRFIDVDSGKDMGPCENILTVTSGQRPGIGGASDRTYVAGKDINTGNVYIATGRNHPALITKSAVLRTPHWLSGDYLKKLKLDGALDCEYKARYGQKPGKCTLIMVHSEEDAVEKGFRKSKYCGLQAVDSKISEGYVVVNFDVPAESITPQQEFVMYDGDVCIGSAAIAMPGETLHEERAKEPRF